MKGTFSQRTVALVTMVVLLLGSGGLALAQTLPVQPVQPLQPLATEEPDDRPGTIPTLDPNSDLPTRPSVPTPTPHPARNTPVPTSDTPLGVATTVPVSTDPVEPSPTAIAPNPQPNQPTIPPDTQPTPANATITLSGMVCPDDYHVIAPHWFPNHSLVEYQEACTIPANAMTVQWGTGGDYAWRNQGMTTGEPYTIIVPPGEVKLRTSVTMRYLDGSSTMTSFTFCTSNLQPYPWSLFPPEGDYTYARFEVAPDEHLQCTRYLETYAPSNLVISMWTCPPGFDPTVPGVKPRTACQRGSEGATLQTIDPVFGQVVVGEPQGPPTIFGPQSMVIEIGPLPRFKSYEVTLLQAGSGSNRAGSFTMGCTEDGLTRGNVQRLRPEDDVLACDWFVVPALPSGSIRQGK